MSNKYYMVELKKMDDYRGSMCVIENNDIIPFEIKRVFYDYDNKSEYSRGNHANKLSKFAFICMNGNCMIEIDDGFNRNTFYLDNPQKMLICDNMIWKKMSNFSKDSVLLVLSNEKYDKNDYIYDYNEFISFVRNPTINKSSKK